MVRYLRNATKKNCKDQFDCILNCLEVCDLGYNMYYIPHVKGFCA